MPLIITLQTLFCLFMLPLWGQSPQEILQEAHASYLQGEKTSDYQTRQLAFNKSLALYHALAQTEPHTADLDQALGDTYFQLNEYAWALLYYNRALQKNSSNPLLLSHLKQTQQKLGLPLSESENETSVKRGFFFALSQVTYLISGLIIITFLVFSYAIWHPSNWIYKGALGSAVLLSLLLINALFFYYTSPVEGILIKTSGLYRAPGENQPQLKNNPLLAGSKVRILQMSQDKHWLKIEEEGMMGYIPTDNLRPISNFD